MSDWDTGKISKDDRILVEHLKKRKTMECKENVEGMSC